MIVLPSEPDDDELATEPCRFKMKTEHGETITVNFRPRRRSKCTTFNSVILPIGIFVGVALSHIFFGLRYTNHRLERIQELNLQLDQIQQITAEKKEKAGEEEMKRIRDDHTGKEPATSALDNLQQQDIPTSSLKPCRIYVENEPSFHFETLESVAMRYPLPLETLNCDYSKAPVVFDYGISNNKRRPEVKYWRNYFDSELEGTRRIRPSDGVQIQFGKATPYLKYTEEQKASYDAIIGATCNHYDDVGAWLDASPNRFCVQHKPCRLLHDSDSRHSEIKSWVDCENPDHVNRTCWLSPDPRHPCHYHPIDLPQFSKCHPVDVDKVNICTIGARKNHQSLSDALRLARNHGNINLNTILLSIHQRDTEMPSEYNSFHSREFIRLVHKDDFVEFQESISKCDLLLPLIEADSNYVTDGKHSGAMSQLMAYRIPTVLHEEIHAIYGPHLTATAKTYNNTESFASALSEMVSELLQKLPEERQKQCQK